ncbi:conserved protein of unknown function [Burkholderia multivorans]
MTRRNYLALGIGITLSIITTYCIILKIEFLMSSELTTGEVVKLEFGGHHPEIKFSASNGQHYKVSIGSRWSVAAGQTVEIRYAPNDPKMSATLNTLLDIWDYTIVAAFLSAAAIITGLRGESLRRSS